MLYNKRLFSRFAIFMCCLAACRAMAQTPCNKNASRETANLCKNLHQLAGEGFLFGHQDNLAYGVEWRYQENRSDVQEVTGDYPAVYGWDLGGIERPNSEKNLDGVPFKKMIQFIQQAYARGGVITISWHADSPLGGGKTAWDTTPGTVASILPGGTHHSLFTSWLNKVAGFIGSLRGKNGEAIPVLFRPFHEQSGNWFWWCRNNCTASEFTSLWRFTNRYLQQEKKLHNLLWVFNTSGNFNTKEELLEYYPGDDVADILSFDAYQYDDPRKSDAFIKNTKSRLALLEAAAKEKNKLFAIAETGYEAIPYDKWWTETLLHAIGEYKICYVLVWRNHGLAEWNNKMHYYAPYKTQVSAADFTRFYALPQTFFEKDAAARKLYAN